MSRLCPTTFVALACPVLVWALAPTPDDDQKPRQIGELTRAINSTLAEAWKEQELKPAPRTTDHQFVRRVYLDLLGRVATPEEVRDFIRDARADKRVRLVEQLLRHPDFARNWASLWSRILLPQPVPAGSFDRLHAWLEEQFKRNLSYKEMFLRLLTASGREDENPATVYVLSHLSEPRPAKDRQTEGMFTQESLTDHSCRTFLGINLNCCRCHDHPFSAEYRQPTWWGLNIFFRQVEQVDVPGARGQPLLRLLRDNPELNKLGRAFYERRNGAINFTVAEFFGQRGPKPEEKRPRRQALAELMLDHPQFNRTIVNRLWTHFLGVSMNESGPFDDTNENNPVLHEALLDLLASEFAKSGHDLKKLMLWICTSDAYQLQFQPTPQNIQPSVAVLCSSMRSKRLGPEQRLESMLTVLRAREVLSPVQLARVRTGWLRTQVSPYPNSGEVPHCSNLPPPEIPYLEAWRFLYESQELHDALAHPQKGTVARAIAVGAGNPERILEEIYLAALNRQPTAREIAWMRKEIKELGKEDTTPFWQDLLWVLFCSSEFIANY
jgi:hypothetical protein